MNRTFTITALVALAFVLTVSGPAQAVTLIGEPFIYPDSLLIGNESAEGDYEYDVNNQWTGAWASSFEAL